MPLIKVQPNGRIKPCVSKETKSLMEEMDELNEFARITGEEDMWKQYRTTRNKCTEAVKRDKREYFGRLYDACETNRDVSRLYKTTRMQLGRK